MSEESKPASSSKSDRPITTKDDDDLERGVFVRHLCDALIDRTSIKATGVVVGITGPWGSGKSSILNLLAEQIKDRYSGQAIIVRFDPWLISGRDNLIRQFIEEIQSSIKCQPDLAKILENFSDVLVEYGTYIGPLVELKYAGFMALFKVGAAVKKRLKNPKSLHSLREKLADSLKEAGIPIIVMIDEIDRVEDEEVKTIAQLVRAIADFPSISYVLAYDPARVIEALGTTDGLNDLEAKRRGSAYLEKIVQHAFPLPVSMPEEITELVLAQLSNISQACGYPKNWRQDPQFTGLLEILIPGLISTPRDVRRWTGHAQVIAEAFTDEVDWCDLLGFAALLAKAPGTIAKLRTNPEILGHYVSTIGYAEMVAETRIEKPSRTERLVPKGENSPALTNLLESLFPYLMEDRGSLDQQHPNRIANRRPLLTVLRFGLLPGTVSRSDIQELFSCNFGAVKEYLTTAIQNNSINSIVDRLDDLYPLELVPDDFRAFWHGVAAFLQKRDGEWLKEYSEMPEIIRGFSDILIVAVQRDPTLQSTHRELLEHFLNIDERELSSSLIRHHIHLFGLFGNTGSSARFFLLEKEVIEDFAVIRSKQYRNEHLNGDLISTLWTLMPVYTMIDIGIWDDACRTRLQSLAEQEGRIGSLSLLLFGGNYTTERQTIEKLVGVNWYLERARHFLDEVNPDQVHPSVLTAVKKALDGR